MSRWFGVLAIMAMACQACSGEAPQTPASPSGNAAALPGVSSGSQSARIIGNVSAGVAPAGIGSGAALTSPLGFASATVPPAPMAVQVVGTPISSPVGTGGGFTLDGVPPGPVQLRFFGSGVDASVAISPVNPGDAISVLVAVVGATATIESESRNAGGTVECEGRIESLDSAALTLKVAGRMVTTSDRTAIRDGSLVRSFADLAVGQRVHVKGTLAPDAVAADLITIQNTNVSLPVNVNGIVERLTGTATAFEFYVGSRKVRGDDKTEFYGDSGLLGFSALKAGARVEVKGELRDDYVYAVRLHVNDATSDEPPQDDSASVEGRLKSITGTGTALTLTITTAGGDVVVTTTGSTQVQRRGSVVPLTTLDVGQTIHAVGVRQSDKSIVARMLQIKDDEPGGRFAIEGSIGGLSGSCLTTVRFGVNGYTIVASSTTTYAPSGTGCSDLKNGMKVQVEGERQADGTVNATNITRK
jgi:hypothetical protein